MFTGRDSELKLLEKLRDEAVGGLRAVLVYGGPGIGKTSLVREYSQRFRRQGGTVVWGRLHEGMEATPFRLWIQVIREWIWRARKEGHRGGTAQADPSTLRTLEAIVPEIVDTAGLRSDVLSPEQRNTTTAGSRRKRPSQRAIVAALADFLRSVVATRPAVVVLDDVHLAPRPSLDVLKVLSEGPNVPLFICLTSREYLEIDPRGALSVTPIELRNLGIDEVRELCRSAGMEPDARLVEQVYEHTHGNPLLVSELTELVRIEGRETLARIDGTDYWEHRIAQRIRPIYRRRIRPLSVDQRRVLIYGAALGPSVDEGKLAAALAPTEGDLIHEALEAGVALGLLTGKIAGEPQYRFPGELARESVLGIADSAERAMIHGSIGRALEEYYRDDAQRHAEELQDHFLRSGELEGIRRGIHWARVAGSEKLEAHSWASARRIFSRLLSQHADFLDEAELAEAQYGLGRSILHSGEKMEAVRHLRAALDYFEQSGDVERVVELSRQVVAYEIGDVDYFRFVETAMKVVPPGSQAYDSIAFFYGVGQMEALGDYERASQSLSDRLAAARQNRDVRIESACLSALAYIDVRYSRPDAAIAKCLQVLDRCQHEEDLYSQVHAEFVLMQAYLLKRDLPSSVHHGERLKDATFAVADNFVISAWYGVVIRFELRTGAWSRARELCEAGLGYDPDSSILLPLRITIEHETGNLEEGDRILDQLIRTVSRYPSGPYLVYASTALAIMGRSCGYSDRRWVPVAREIVEMLLGSDCPPAVGVRALMALGLICLSDQDRSLARETYGRLRSAPRFNLVRDYRVELILARLARLVGNDESAGRHFEAATHDAESYPDRPHLGWIHYYRAEMFVRPLHGGAVDAAAGNRHLRQSIRIARELSMKPLEEKCRELQRHSRNNGDCEAKRSAERTLSRSSSLAAHGLSERNDTMNPLSERELQVLRLLAEGMSDKEIGGILGLSVHTVSNHVRHILRKTASANRVVAVNVAKREGML